jgi:hypothetical protein
MIASLPRILIARICGPLRHLRGVGMRSSLTMLFEGATLRRSTSVGSDSIGYRQTMLTLDCLVVDLKSE